MKRIAALTLSFAGSAPGKLRGARQDFRDRPMLTTCIDLQNHPVANGKLRSVLAFLFQLSTQRSRVGLA